MLALNLVLKEPAWPDLADKTDKIIHVTSPLGLAYLEAGMESGARSVMLRVDLPDGRVVLAETSFALLALAVRGIAAVPPPSAQQPEPVGTFACPRRYVPADNPETPDHWRTGPTSLCSYCGSMRPGEFMELARGGVELGPTDKDYKVYVGADGKFYFSHLSREERQEFVELMNAKKLNIGMPGHFYVLPFFVTSDEPKLA